MNKEKKNLLVFGYGLCVLILLLAFKYQWQRQGIGMIVLIAGVVGFLFMVTSLKVELLRSFYKNWMKVALGIGHIVSSVILTVIFYFIFTPIAVILRLLHKDLLGTRRMGESYWLKRPVKGGAERLEKQF